VPADRPAPVSVRVAIVGHVEWVEFLVVPGLPHGGEVSHAESAFTRAAGGGGVAAGVLAELGAEVELFTAFGEDWTCEQACAQLRRRGVTVHAARRAQQSRRAVALLERGGERTIVTIGERLAPQGSDPLPWPRLAEADAVYFTAGDRDALARARLARVLVATPRAGTVLTSGPRVDALIWSAADAHESALAERSQARADVLIATDGERGGRWWAGPEASGDGAVVPSDGRWQAVAVPGPVHDSYGAGDAFAAAVAFALGAGHSLSEAVSTGAQWGARMLARPGAP
jgi:ribokinase